MCFFFSFPFSEKKFAKLRKFAPNNSHCFKKKREVELSKGQTSWADSRNKIPFEKVDWGSTGQGGQGVGRTHLSLFSRWKTEAVAMGGKLLFLLFSLSFRCCGSENK
jgi:hypothetical protein